MHLSVTNKIVFFFELFQASLCGNDQEEEEEANRGLTLVARRKIIHIRPVIMDRGGREKQSNDIAKCFVMSAALLSAYFGTVTAASDDEPLRGFNPCCS